jgi:hypothetical protein
MITIELEDFIPNDDFDPDNIPEGLDREERHHALATREHDALWKTIELARHEPMFALSTEDYIQTKIKHGNAEWEAAHAAKLMRNYTGAYRGTLTTEWMREQYRIKLRKPALAQVWKLWRNVLAVRKALADLPADASTRKRIEAEVAVDRNEGLYDLYSRAFDGRVPRTHEQLLSLRVKAPSRPEPSRRPVDKRRRARASMNWE